VTAARLLALGVAIALAAAAPAYAQENYEIQVYASETLPAGTTMFELHSNYTLDGRKVVEAGVLPTHRSLHETLEITHGFTSWFEVGSYLFTSHVPGQSLRFVGSRIRPRVRAPAKWRWPVGVSLSMEVGYQERDFSPDSWSTELRPIVDKQFGAWYVSLNPAVEHALRGDNAAEGFVLSPNMAVTRDVTEIVNLGVEYYGGLGPARTLAPREEQEHQLFGVINLRLSPDFEFNAGYGVGLTGATEGRMIKLILGRRVGSRTQ
jgi:hypothetical protein